MKVMCNEVVIRNQNWHGLALQQTGRERGLHTLDPFSCSLSGELNLLVNTSSRTPQKSKIFLKMEKF